MDDPFDEWSAEDFRAFEGQVLREWTESLLARQMKSAWLHGGNPEYLSFSVGQLRYEVENVVRAA